MKKLIAILMSAILLLGMFAACGKEDPGATAATEGDPVTPIAAGMLVLNASAALNISYDAEGLVLNVEGIDENGSVLAADYTDFLGKSASETVADLIAASSHSGFLNAEENYIMIKQAVGSALPGATFLETVEKDAQAALDTVGSTAAIVLLSEENLDEDGYINLDAAKVLVCAYLAVDALDTLDGTPTPTNGLYNFRITAGDYADDLIVDATSGDVYQGLLEDTLFEDDNDDLVDTADPTDEVVVEEIPQVTDAPTEPAANPDNAVDPADPTEPSQENAEVE